MAKQSEKPVEKPKSTYEALRSVNVNDHAEKKGKLTYLSWAWAVDVLLQHDEEASWEYDENKVFKDETVMVFCTVNAFGRSRKVQLPVMDNMNKPIKNPNSFQVNTAMQRCLAKAIALHGLGLYIYAGEDLPDGADDKKTGAGSDDKAPKDEPAPPPAQKPATPMPDQEYDKYRIAISEAADMSNLQAAFTQACDKAREYRDGPAVNGFIKLKDIRKKELEAM